ncbi:MAG: trimethylamine methyltransferase family protein [Anaerolineae bacterium]
MEQDVNKLRFLSEDGLHQIEQTARRLLAEVGVSLQHAEARAMLRGLGCRINGERALIPEGVVAWALKNVTPHRDFYNVDGSRAFRLDGGGFRFHNSGGLPFTRDLETGQRRRATRQDIADMSTLLDALPNVDVVVPMYSAQDVPGELLAVASTDAMLRHTRKPCSASAIDRPEDVPYVIQMAAACCGDMDAFLARPTMTISVSPVSPLRFTNAITDTLIAVATAGAPLNALPAPSMGATSPVTMAGALAQQHAEILATFVIAAAARPGIPVAYCSRISPIDLRSAVSSWGGPEVGITAACAGQLAHRIGLPCDAYGFATSARTMDAQAAYERLTNALLPALGGVDVLSGVASIESVLTGALDVAVIDNELIGLLRHVARGCSVGPETLAIEVMEEVITRDGVFLGERHTVEQIRQGAIWLPMVGDRASSADSVGDGVIARARARAREILSTHHVDPLPDDVSRQLDEIVQRARCELVT